MQLLSVRTSNIKELIDDKSSFFDLAIFACGYESRCTALARVLDHSRFSKMARFTFKELKGILSGEESKRYYDEVTYIQDFEIRGSDDVGVYEALRTLDAQIDPDKPLRVFVDYSSMSRVWYGAILNFFRHSSRSGRVELSLGYMAGEYRGEVRANHVEVISAVPGFEGIAAGSGSSSAMFALGFDPWCAYAILERIEPDQAWTLLAERPDLPEYLARAKNLNRDFIENYANTRVLVHPTFDVEGVFGSLCEWVARELSQTSDIAFIGLGPKPHILSMMLTAIRFPEVSIVQARGRPVSPRDVKAQGQGVCASVTFVPGLIQH